MSYKLKITVTFFGFCFLVISVFSLLTYNAFKTFSREAFFDRLEQKAVVTIELLAELQKDENTISHVLDTNPNVAANKELMNVFDNKDKLLFETGDQIQFKVTQDLLNKIRQKKEVEFLIAGNYQVCGIEHTYKGKDYVVVIVAKDIFGEVKLANLRKFILMPIFLSFILIAIGSYFFIQQVFQPIDKLNSAIKKVISTNNYEKIETKSPSKDLNQIAENFNTMMERLEKLFEYQKKFNQNASHQLKTPIAVMAAQLEKFKASEYVQEETIISLKEVNDKMAKLVDYMLLINRLQETQPIPMALLKADELMFELLEEAQEFYDDFNILLDFNDIAKEKGHLNILANKILLKSAWMNLINNAYMYSLDKCLKIEVLATDDQMIFRFYNKGEQELDSEIVQQKKSADLEVDFNRNGLGLSIVENIILYHKGSWHYSFQNMEHIFEIHLNKLNQFN